MEHRLVARVTAARNLAHEARRLGAVLGGKTKAQLREFAVELEAFALTLEATTEDGSEKKRPATSAGQEGAGRTMRGLLPGPDDKRNGAN
jgi:hypothetical protein